MSQSQVDAVVAKAKTDAKFRKALRENPTKALEDFHLTDKEEADLKARHLGVEPAAANPVDPSNPMNPEAPPNAGTPENPGSLGGRPVR